jgi:hypothetical protein
MKDYLNYIDRNQKSRNLLSLISYVDQEVETSQAAYEATGGKSKFDTSRSNTVNTEDKQKKRNVNSVSKTKSEKKCADCADNHPVWRCSQFQQKSVNERLKVVKNNELCFLCLGKGHRKTDCYFKGKCDVDRCSGGHHKLLHQVKESPSTNARSRDVHKGSMKPHKLDKEQVRSKASSGQEVKV